MKAFSYQVDTPNTPAMNMVTLVLMAIDRTLHDCLYFFIITPLYVHNILERSRAHFGLILVNIDTLNLASPCTCVAF